MKTIRRVGCILAIESLFFVINLTGQESLDINGKRFVPVDSVWHIEYLGERFKVDETSITVKWKARADTAKIDSMLDALGAAVRRRNILGFVDLRVRKPVNFISVLRSFLESDLVEMAEANSFAKPQSVPSLLPFYSNDQHFGNQWYLSQANDVDLDINEAWSYTTGHYDMLGREVSILVDEIQQPGQYSVRWDGSELPSGVYYYRLVGSDFTDAKRLLLVR